ncbi:cytochrome P450 [Trametes meyenii]|nr:cytochrome P450 [Trametes meyenii]
MSLTYHLLSLGAFDLGLSLALSYLVFFYVKRRLTWRKRTQGRHLPPGPRALPLLGSILEIPKHRGWQGFRELSAKYNSSLVYFDVLGSPMVVVGTARGVTELLEKRSANSPDRPHSEILPLVGNDVAFSSMRYGQVWREHRRAFWQIFHPGAISGYRETQRAVLLKFLKNLSAAPQRFEEHIRYLFSATMMKVLYGLEAREENDPFISQVSVALNCVSELAGGSHPIDHLPFLRYVPGWVPGAGFQYELARCKAAVSVMKEVPFAQMMAVERPLSTEPTLASLLSRFKGERDAKGTAQLEEMMKNVGLVAFEAGSDTSFSTMMGFFLAISQYSEVQKKAQAELDAVVGRDRLPDYTDRDNLVYVNAVIRECVRWHVVVPLGIPHRTLEDDMFEDYFIPAGTMIIANTWAILHDPELYSHPEVFNPERFIRDGKIDLTVPDPYSFAFGYGRRVCPGRHFADDILYLAMASILHVFNIEPPLDEGGRLIKIELEQTSGLLSYPSDCRCMVKPRWDDAISLIVEV